MLGMRSRFLRISILSTKQAGSCNSKERLPKNAILQLSLSRFLNALRGTHGFELIPAGLLLPPPSAAIVSSCRSPHLPAAGIRAPLSYRFDLTAPNGVVMSSRVFRRGCLSCHNCIDPAKID
jgi:hypothetical protein